MSATASSGRSRTSVAMITGSGAGIGLATAQRWTQRFGPVIAMDRDSESLRWAEKREDVVRVVGDVREADVFDRAVEKAVERFGGLDCVVFNAGVSGTWGGVMEQSESDFDRILDINLKSVLTGLRCVVPTLSKSPNPSVVTVASVSGMGGEPDHLAYTVSKAALINLTRSAALDLAPRGIRVNAIAPGPVTTNLTAQLRAGDRETHALITRAVPMNRWAEPAEIAEAILFLGSPAASFVTGALLPVDGGTSCKSGLAMMRSVRSDEQVV